MQTILGANGIIGEELAKELNANYTKEIRLVGRNPMKVNASDELCKADLLNVAEVKKAVAGTEIAYLTVGLPYDSKIWVSNWPIIMHNVIQACKEEGCKLVYFDNTYMYPQGAKIQTEETPFSSKGKKGKVKGETAKLLLKEMESGQLEAMICRAPEFYGPGKTKGITNTLVFDKIKANAAPTLFLSDSHLRTLIFTPDASKAMALLANSTGTFGETWHLPCDDERLTYKQFIETISEQLSRKIDYKILKKWQLKIASFFNSNVKETQELLPRYEIDNIFDSSKFKDKFPDFRVTTYAEGINIILQEMK